MRIQQIVLCAALALALGADAAAVDWAAHADEDVIEVVTSNEDGSTKTTKIWLVVVEGAGYIRTGSTSWGKNVNRDADVRIRTATGDYDLRVAFVSDEAVRAAVTQAFRDKYGWSDRIISPFRGSSPLIMRLDPRPGGG